MHYEPGVKKKLTQNKVHAAGFRLFCASRCHIFLFFLNFPAKVSIFAA